MPFDGSISTNYTDTRALSSNAMTKASQALAQETAAIAAGDVSVDRMAEVKVQQNLYTLNMQMLKMTDDMVGQVLDMLA